MVKGLMIPKTTRKMKGDRLNWHFAQPKSLRLDLGCGPNPREGFVGFDRIAFNEKVQCVDLRDPWPWDDESVNEIHSSHFVEHLTAIERCHFFNELFRVLKPNVKNNGQNVEGFATIIVPHWSSCRAYGDPTHQWPPMGDFFWYYLDADWRAQNAPHADRKNWEHGYDCHLECVWGYSFDPELNLKNDEYRAFAMKNYREQIQDMIVTINRKEKRNGG